MASQDGAQEIIVLFDAQGSKIDLEMRFEQFNALLAQKATLGSHAASTVRAAYAQVGAGLVVRAVVFFLFRVNDSGYVDPAFNLPLDYMAQNAGQGPDLGNGPIVMACRSQCPVPWHSINVWEPSGELKSHPAMLVQKAVWRNRLGLKPVPMTAVSNGAAKSKELAGARAAQRVEGGVQLDQAANGTIGRARLRAIDETLTATFGDAGRVNVSQYTRQHREHMAEQFRSEMERQQQGYLEQIKGCREEIQKLKSALRHEKERNRRLQQLLRGDV
ncbi:MAG: hypothetical protein RIC56_20605 [Pseudomonadales bacterium]